MPGKPLALRKVRESAKRDMRMPKVSLSAWVYSDGTEGLYGDDIAPSREAARLAWPHYRRPVWAHTCRGMVPIPSTIYDGLQTAGFELLHSTWNKSDFNLQTVLEALEADRAAVRAFQARDPNGAADIADYLREFLDYLAAVERKAQQMALMSIPMNMPWRRGYPHIEIKGRYGDNEQAHREGQPNAQQRTQ
jgi:hypothetical protein